jgi:colicin import membrane protein
MKLPVLYLCLLILAPPLAAQDDPENMLTMREAEQREWIARTREKYDAQFRAQEIACYQRFAVNDCLNDVHKTERAVKADLRRQEILINDAERKRRGARQLLRSDERLRADP